MYCPACGSPNIDNARFCSECGHTLPAPQQRGAAIGAQVASPYQGAPQQPHQPQAGPSPYVQPYQPQAAPSPYGQQPYQPQAATSPYGQQPYQPVAPNPPRRKNKALIIVACVFAALLVGGAVGVGLWTLFRAQAGHTTERKPASPLGTEAIVGLKSIPESAYSEVIARYDGLYGGHGVVGNGTVFATGLALADTIDFDGDGTDELLLAYGDPASFGTDEHGVENVEQHVEVWGFQDDEAVLLYQGEPSTSDAGNVVNLYRNKDQTYVVERVSSGKIVPGQDYATTYWGYRDGAFRVVFRVSYRDGESSLDYTYQVDGKEVSEEEFKKQIGVDGDIDQVLYALSGYTSDTSALDETFRTTDETISTLHELEGADDTRENAEPPVEEEPTTDEVVAPPAEEKGLSYDEARAIYEGAVYEVDAAHGTHDPGCGHYYTLEDLDGNGIPELIMAYDTDGAQYADRQVCAVWTINANDELVCLLDHPYRGGMAILTDGRVKELSSNSAFDSHLWVWQVDGDQVYKVVSIDHAGDVDNQNAPTYYTDLDQGISEQEVESGFLSEFGNGLSIWEGFDWQPV